MSKRNIPTKKEIAKKLSEKYSRQMLEYLRLVRRYGELQLAGKLHSENKQSQIHRDKAIIRRRIELVKTNAAKIWGQMLNLYEIQDLITPPF